MPAPPLPFSISDRLVHEQLVRDRAVLAALASYDSGDGLLEKSAREVNGYDTTQYTYCGARQVTLFGSLAKRAGVLIADRLKVWGRPLGSVPEKTRPLPPKGPAQRASPLPLPKDETR